MKLIPIPEPKCAAFLIVSFVAAPTVSQASGDSGGFFSWKSSKKDSAKKAKRSAESYGSKKSSYGSKDSKKGKLKWGAWENYKPGQ